MNIGYLGSAGSYSNEAAIRYKEDKDTLIEYSTIKSVIEALEEGKTEKCIVPIENAIYGSVIDTVDSLLEYKDIYIVEEIVLDIEHKLMAKSKDSRIAKILSHPQALSQCEKTLNERYKGIEKVEVASTSYAASIAAKESDIACICSGACKDIYNLEIIDENMQDITGNQTRFIVLSKEKNDKKCSKTSIIFSTKDEPGALYKILGIFSVNEINLSKIESRPARTKLGDYMFFADLDGDQNDEKISNAFLEIQKFCEEFRVLGSY